MNSIGLFVVVLIYLAILFFIANMAEKSRRSFWVNNPYIYSLSLAVYCTAWTYYGSIGVAARQGLHYMAVYIGPAIVIPAWIIIVMRIIRISRVNKISSIADFVSLRYGNSRFLGALITIVCVLAIVPYISLQIKAISETFHLIVNTGNSKNIFFDSATYVVILIAIFSSYYGTRYVDASEKRLGIISAVAVESLLKLIFFVVLGLFVTYGVFSGFNDIYQKAALLENFQKLNTFNGVESSLNWFLMCLLAATAIILLPRQFHTTIVENRRERHVKTAMWVFPLYLLIINFFVFPIAWGGNLLFKDQSVNAEMYSILIPQKFGNLYITIMVFLGGLSSSVSMIIISSIALSIMLSNNLIIPYGIIDVFGRRTVTDNSKMIVNTRKISIFLLIILSFLFYKYSIRQNSLFSIGLTSFVIISQLAPSFFAALFWKRGSYYGAVTGIFAGVAICYMALILPDFMQTTWLWPAFSFFKIPYLDTITQTFFWSILVNSFLFAVISVSIKGNYRERNFAEMYVDIDKYVHQYENAYIWKGTAYIADIEKILFRFLGVEKTRQALKIFNEKYNLPDERDTADARLIRFSENLLAGRIGTASAKILIEGVTKEDKISLPEVLRILEESKENISMNKQLTEQSKKLQLLSGQLKKANDALVAKDKQKDEFLDAVAHELRTPITAIRAAGELLQDDSEMPQEIQQQFLNNIISESDRLSELINDILYLDKLETTETVLNIESHKISDTFQMALRPMLHLIQHKSITLTDSLSSANEILMYDEKRMVQVFNNLLANAIKFTDEGGRIDVNYNRENEESIIQFYNSGEQIGEDELELIFEKFYQSKNRHSKKAVGSGIGLAICKKIVEAHNGTIKANNYNSGVLFTISLPKKQEL